MLNLFLCYDLIKLIKSPFTPPGSRNKFYYVMSFGVPLVMICLILGINYIKNKNEGAENCLSCISLFYNTNVTSANIGTMITGFGNYVLSFVMSCYILLAIYSVIYAEKRLRRQEDNSEIRKLFL